MDSIATIVIPVGVYHQHLAPLAIASANAQTVPCNIVPIYDLAERGAGYARNAGARGVESPFLVFLDADDTLEPNYVERCLDRYQKGSYVYTAWHGHSYQRPHPTTPFVNNGYHLVTTLFPTKAFHALKGFDEQLPGHEDVDFYLRAAMHGLCPVYVDEALVNYSPAGERSRKLIARDDYYDIRRLVYERNGGERTIMAGNCCSGGAPIPPPMGDRQEGDVMALLLWSGLRTEPSFAQTGRSYRGGNGQLAWVAPGDIEGRPDLFKKVFDVSDLTPDKTDVLVEAGLI